MIDLFYTVLYDPFLNALMLLYRFLGGNMGLAIIGLTLVIKALLFSPSLSQLKAQRALQETQPKLKELQERYKNDKQAYNKAVLEFYKENKVNPLSSCLPLLLQLPVLITLYQVFIAGLATDPMTHLLSEKSLEHLYGPLRDYFSSTPISTMFLGIDLDAKKNLLLAVVTGAATYWQSHMLMRQQPPKTAGTGGKDESMAASMNKTMLYFTPAITTFFAYSFPAGLGVYWLVSTLFQVGQQYYFLHRHVRPAASEHGQ